MLYPRESMMGGVRRSKTSSSHNKVFRITPLLALLLSLIFSCDDNAVVAGVSHDGNEERVCTARWGGASCRVVEI